MSSKWYAVRTVPGSQKPKRLFLVEPTSLGADGRPRGKGYRIVPTLNPNISDIERELTNAGFSFYMPSEKRLVRDRKHTDLWKPRRFALLVGYVFIHEPHSWVELENLSGVAHIVKCVTGKPLEVDILDIMTLRSMEAIAEEEFDQQCKAAIRTLRQKAKRDNLLKKLLRQLDAADELTVRMGKDYLAA